MKTKEKKGFTIIEVIAAVSISVVIMTCIAWNVSGLKQMGRTHLSVNRAAMLTTAKEALVRERGIMAFQSYSQAQNDEARFALIKRFLPYTNRETSLSQYTPNGVVFAMNDLGTKVGLTNTRTHQPINY